MPTGAGVDLDYPRYQGAQEPRLDSEVSNLKPNRRPLIIGGALAVVGIIILLVVKLGGGSKAEEPVLTGSDQPGSDIQMPVTTGSGSESAAAAPVDNGSGSADIADDMISVHVESTPSGADVLVAGTKIGVTPLDKKLHRGTKTQPLTVHLEGFADVTSKIDLSGDFSKKVTMKTAAELANEAAAGSGSAHHEAVTPPHDHKTPDHDHEHVNTPPPVHKPKCQPPGPNVDPINGPPVCRPGEKP